MITLNYALKVHDLLIQEHGGKTGIRNITILESAINRPFSGLADAEFYPSVEEKSAVILESVVAGHPFTDGNKRTGYALMRLFLRSNGLDIAATEEDKYELVIAVASSQLKFDDIVVWLKNHIVHL